MGDAPPNSLYSNFQLLAVLLSYAFGIVQGPGVTVACLEFKHIPLCVHDCTVLVDRGRSKTIRLGICCTSLQKSATLLRQAGLLPGWLGIPRRIATARFQYVEMQSRFQENSNAFFAGAEHAPTLARSRDLHVRKK